MSAATAPQLPPRRWRPAPLIAGSMGLHCAAGVSAFFGPEVWPWVIGSVAANHAVLGALGMWPRSRALGPNLVRLPGAAAKRREVALTFDDGPEPDVTPRVLELLAGRRVHATFFCIASKAARHPALAREIARHGHAIENHSRAHRATFPLLGIGGMRGEIASAQQILAELSGHAPRFFRAPAGLRNPLLDPVLHELGLSLVTWTRRAYDTRRCDGAAVAARLTRGLAAGDILLLHDGHCARRHDGTPVILDALPRVLDALESARLRPVTLAQAIDA